MYLFGGDDSDQNNGEYGRPGVVRVVKTVKKMYANLAPKSELLNGSRSCVSGGA